MVFYLLRPVLRAGSVHRTSGCPSCANQQSHHRCRNRFFHKHLRTSADRFRSYDLIIKNDIPIFAASNFTYSSCVLLFCQNYHDIQPPFRNSENIICSICYQQLDYILGLSPCLYCFDCTFCYWKTFFYAKQPPTCIRIISSPWLNGNTHCCFCLYCFGCTFRCSKRIL